jgi:hypothetical protein
MPPGATRAMRGMGGSVATYCGREQILFRNVPFAFPSNSEVPATNLESLRRITSDYPDRDRKGGRDSILADQVESNCVPLIETLHFPLDTAGTCRSI